MSIVVQKYGGSSVADLDKIRHVADKVVETRLAGHDVVVVVSAMGKTTESLLDLGRSALASSLSTSPLRRRELDMLVSAGERISMSLLSLAILGLGFEAQSFTGSQSGILTSCRHFDARIMELRPERIRESLSRGRIAVVAGYQGMSLEREITTLGRGGSDTTAVALAAALGAARCEIYSDVDGVYTADPRHIPEARHIPALAASDMLAIAQRGARVLNARAVAFARDHRMRIVARRTWDVDGGRETRIEADAAEMSSHVVVCDPDVVLLRVSREHEAEFLQAAEEAQLGLRDVIGGNAVEQEGPRGDAVLAVTATSQAADFRTSLLEVERACRVSATPGLGQVSLVFPHAPNEAERQLARRLAAPATLVWEHDRYTSCLVDAERARHVERDWHRAFCEAGADSVGRLSA